MSEAERPNEIPTSFGGKYPAKRDLYHRYQGRVGIKQIALRLPGCNSDELYAIRLFYYWEGMRNQLKTITFIGILLLLTVSHISLRPLPVFSLQCVYAQVRRNAIFRNNNRPRADTSRSNAPIVSRPGRNDNASTPPPDNRSQPTKHRITITYQTIEDSNTNAGTSNNWKSNWAVFATSGPNVTLENADVVVIGEVHEKQDKENIASIQHLGAPDEVKVYKEGYTSGETASLGSGYTAHGIENKKLYNETGYIYGDLILLQASLKKSNFNPDADLAQKYAAALHDFNIYETLRAKTAAERVADGLNKQRALIVGFEHVLGTRTPMLLPELTRQGVDWIALVPRKLQVPADAELPRVLTTDNIGNLYRLHNEENVSALYHPYHNSRNFSFLNLRAVTNQDLIALKTKLSRMQLRPFHNPSISTEVEMISD